jgi:hypothetical protein
MNPAQIVLVEEAPPPPRRNITRRSKWSNIQDHALANPGKSWRVGEFPEKGPGAFPVSSFNQRGIKVITRKSLETPGHVGIWIEAEVLTPVTPTPPPPAQ